MMLSYDLHVVYQYQYPRLIEMLRVMASVSPSKKRELNEVE
jgi:hypothetical protein